MVTLYCMCGPDSLYEFSRLNHVYNQLTLGFNEWDKNVVTLQNFVLLKTTLIGGGERIFIALPEKNKTV